MSGVIFVFLLGFAPHTFALSNGQAASLVIGQPNFTSSATTPVTQPAATSLNQPTGIAFDSGGNLWVADWSEGRILQYSGSVTTTSTTRSFMRSQFRWSSLLCWRQP